MRQSSLVIATVCFVLGLSGRFLVGQDIPVKGKVVDEQGDPLNKVLILFTDPQAGTSFQCKSNKKGEFMRVGMPISTYKVRAELVGYKVYETYIELRGVTHVQVDIRLPKVQEDVVQDEHFQKGMDNFEKKLFQEAAEEFRQSLAIYPDSIEINYNLAVSLINIGLFDEAVSSLLKVESLKSDMPGLYMAMATAYEKKNELPQSLDAYIKAAAQNPADHLPMYYAGAIHFKLGESEKALLAYTEAIKRNDQFAPVYYQVGVVASALSKFADAVSYFETFLTLAPNAPESTAVKEMVAELKKALK